MYKQCRTEQSSKRQRELEQGLLQTMLKQQYEQISVTDLCQQMNIPRKAFYRYFDSKDGALYSLLDHAIMDFDRYSTADNLRQIRDAKIYMEKVFHYWIQNKDLLDALSRSNLSGILVLRAVEYAKEMNSLPFFLANMDKHLRNYGTLFGVCGLMTIIVQWHHDGYVPSVEEMAEISIRLLSNPLFKPQE